MKLIGVRIVGKDQLIISHSALPALLAVRVKNAKTPGISIGNSDPLVLSELD